MQRSLILLTVVFLILVPGVALAQSDVSASLTGLITDQVSGKGLDETTTKSLGLLFSYRHFSNHNGFEANYGYSKNSQKLSDQSGNALTSVQSNIYEITGAYVWRASRGSFRPFALAGGGLMTFGPTSSAIDNAVPTVSRQYRPTFLYGVGVDVNMSKNTALRAQYRGLVYESPDFFGANIARHTSAAMQTAEPSIGVVYRF